MKNLCKTTLTLKQKTLIICKNFKINHNKLLSLGYTIISPNGVTIDKNYIYNNYTSIYHYHGSCPIGEVVDENLKLKVQELRDEGEKAHSDGDHSKSEKLLNEALDLISG